MESPAPSQDALPGSALTRNTVYAYGCHFRADLEPAVFGQLRLANQLWNKLVEIELAHESRKDEIWLTDPAVAAATRILAIAEQSAEAAREAARRARQHDRTTIPRDTDKAALDAARTEVRAARAAQRKSRAAAAPALRPAFTEALRERGEAVKATYPEFTRLGLGWGTYNDIVRRRFGPAVARVRDQRKSGKPASLRFHSFDGTGTITVQVMGGAGIPSRTIPALNSGQHPRSAVFRLEPWADPATGKPHGREARSGTATIRVGRTRSLGPIDIQVPVVLHRYIPADADITEVKITRFRSGTRFRLRLAVACIIPAAAPPEDGATVAVRMSWAAAGNGAIRAAVIGTDKPLPPLPGELAPAVRVSGSHMSAEVLCPPEWQALMSRDHAIQAVRDHGFNAIREKAADALDSDPDLAGRLGVRPQDMRRWRSIRRLNRVAVAWPPDHELAPLLAEWRARDRHLWDYASSETDQVLARRKDTWRKVAAWLCTGARAVAVHDLPLDVLRVAAEAGAEDSPESRGARANMHRAAPGELRSLIVTAAKSRSIPVFEIKGDAGA